MACAAPPATSAGCGSCHTDPPAGVHAAIPCEACHLGHPELPTREAAHAGMEKEPGALDTVDRTCGVCHPVEVARVRTLPMTTGRGIVGVDRFVFGELPTPDTEQTLADVLHTATPTPAEDHLRRLCAGCHLGTRKDNRDDVIVGGSGCSACHSIPTTSGHSAITAKVPDSQCFGCHSRSSRISLTYAGQVEGACTTQLPDGRTTCATTPDVHQAAGLACIDCHVHTELMGDGVSRAHQEEQVEIRCTSCHGESPAPMLDDPITRRLPHEGIVAAGTRGTPLWNVSATGLTGKLDGRQHPLPRVAPTHAGRGHDRLDCVACHATAAPTCASCHTSYTADDRQYDFGVGHVVPGRWVERGANEGLAPPALGVLHDRIRPAIPGMVGEINGRATRRFALLDPHSTQRQARTCVDCHRSSVALGLGTGLLDPATFRFTPTTAVPGFPGLAADGWTTLGATTPGEGTRVGARSLNASEQRRILRVGVCLGCHEGTEIERWPSLDKRPGRCELGRGWWNNSLH